MRKITDGRIISLSEFVITVDGKKKNIKIIDDAALILDGRKLNYEMHRISSENYLLKVEKKFFDLTAQKINGDVYSVTLNGSVFETVVRTNLQERASKIIEQQIIVQHKIEVRAPMPGMILKIKIRPGDHVEKGDSIIILEAMKMENDLHAPVSGTITDVYVKEGNAVDKNARLLLIE